MARSQPGGQRGGGRQKRSGTTRTRSGAVGVAGDTVYRELFDNAPDAIALVDSAGVITTVNRKAEQLLGWSRQELEGQHYGKVVTPATATTAEDRTRRFLAGERLSAICVAELVRRDGSVVPVEACTCARRDAAGHVIGVQGVFRELTERPRPDQALRASEERYRLLSESICDYALAFSCDTAGDLSVDWLTESFTTLTGYGIEDLRGQPNPLRVYIHPDDAEAVLRTVTGLHPGTRTTYTCRIVTKDGQVRWVESRARALADDTGTVVRVVGAATDITDRVKAEADQQDTQRLQAMIADTVPDVLCVYDIPQDRVVYVNPQVVEVLGYPPQEILGSGVARLRQWVPEEDWAHLAQCYEHLVSSREGGMVDAEHGVLHRNGEVRWLYHRAVAVRRARDGTPEQILTIGHDITRRKRLEQLWHAHVFELKEMPERLRRFRERLGMTQSVFGTEFASASGPYNARQLSSYETGNAAIPVELLLTIRAKGYPLEAVLGSGPTALMEKTVAYFSASHAERVVTCRLLEVVLGMVTRDRALMAQAHRELSLPLPGFTRAQEKLLEALADLDKQRD